MLKNKDERSNYLKNDENWELIDSVPVLGISYYKLHVSKEKIIIRRVSFTFNQYAGNRIKNEYFYFDETHTALVPTCFSALVEDLKNIQGEN